MPNLPRCLRHDNGEWPPAGLAVKAMKVVDPELRGWGAIDLEQRTLQPLDNPFGPEVVTHVSGTKRYPSLRVGQ